MTTILSLRKHAAAAILSNMPAGIDTYHRSMTQLARPEAIVPGRWTFEQERQLKSGTVTVHAQTHRATSSG